jgi:hypothetical protein
MSCLLSAIWFQQRARLLKLSPYFLAMADFVMSRIGKVS